MERRSGTICGPRLPRCAAGRRRPGSSAGAYSPPAAASPAAEGPGREPENPGHRAIDCAGIAGVSWRRLPQPVIAW